MTKANLVQVPISANLAHLSARERSLLNILQKVVEVMDEIYLLQHSSRPVPFYPTDLTNVEFERYVSVNSGQRAALESPFTAIQRKGQVLEAVSYAELYQADLRRAAALLREAAEFCDNKEFRAFLLAKAEAFTTNQHTASDIAWIKTTEGPFDLTVGPYEEYEDLLLGRKRVFQGILGLVLPAENEKIHVYQEWAAAFDKELGARLGYQPSGASCPMVVIDQITTGGYARHGFVHMAFNLPNDKEIKESVGSKKVFVKNVIAAKLEHITRKIAERVISPDLLEAFRPEIYMLKLIGHEIAHGFGAYCHDGLRELGTPLEEAKSDAFGLMFIYFLADRGVVDGNTGTDAAIVRVVDGLRRIRLNPKEAHGLAALIECRWLVEHGALSLDNGKLDFHVQHLRNAVESLGAEFVRLALAADYGKAREFVDRWGQPVPGLEAVLESLEGIPLDIEPV